MLTRRGIADEIDRLDEQIAELNQEKASIFKAYREQRKKAGADVDTIKTEQATLKAAIRLRRNGTQAAPGAMLDEFLDEIRQPDPAPSRAHAHEARDSEARQ